MDRLDGRSALVTGGGRGIGAAIARALAAEGASVTVVSRTAAEVDAVAAEIGGKPVVADVNDGAALTAALVGVGPVDVLVANAGVVGPLGPFADTDLDDWERNVTTNVFGAVRVVAAFLGGMVERGWGRIITISSGAARPPGMPAANAYSVSKAALDMFTLHLARELDGSGVTVNAVRPGVVDTSMQEFMRSLPRERVGPEFYDRFHGLHQRGELVDPADSARFVIDTLLSDRHGEILDIRDPR